MSSIIGVWWTTYATYLGFWRPFACHTTAATAHPPTDRPTGHKVSEKAISITTDDDRVDRDRDRGGPQKNERTNDDGIASCRAGFATLVFQ